MRWKKNTKRGSYLVEAALVLPIFILAAVLLLSLLPFIASCENAVFAAADEVRRESLQAAFGGSPSLLKQRTERRLLSENPGLTGCSEALRYRYRKQGICDLLTVQPEVFFRQNRPLAMAAETEFRFTVTGRAFTGAVQRRPPLPREDFEREEKAEPVYIFPEAGKRFHAKSCTYVQANCRLQYLNRRIRRKYRPCRRCHAGGAKDGTPVYCFTKTGRVYHLEGCRAVKRYYMEIDRKEAVKKGYTPCKKCGGGR